ncbi:MAG: response regulator [Promethearchaeota archaeon]|nr:MAG: response regulator [Candidatus Lokiarchaeota archaeon]
MNIFIVEDDFSLENLYKSIISFIGYNIVAVANNGEEAVEIYKSLEQKPDIIIMDNRMPIKNGLEATKEILEIDNEVKIIFASADLSIKEKALMIGAKAFLEKPFAIKTLKETIERVSLPHAAI